MKKIPTIFERDWHGDKSRVLNKPTDAWHKIVRAFPYALPTEKWDGTCCAVIGGVLYKRYDAKNGKTPPAGAIPCCEPDEKTGHHPHWLPVRDGPEDQWFRSVSKPINDGTYELIGEKIGGNPYGIKGHEFRRHGDRIICKAVPLDYAVIRTILADLPIEGIVWWLAGDPIGKIKRTDFGLPWPIPDNATEDANE